MRRSYLAAGLATAVVLSTALAVLVPTATRAQTGQERTVVFETFGREA